MKSNASLTATIYTLLMILSRPAGASILTFQAAPPIPNASDAYNFIGGSRDGLNVNDDNGLDGPLNDNFTYVANDRPRQGQTFMTPPGDTAVIVKSIWIKMVGYTNNGSAPEPGYNGTDTDLSSGGEFMIRVGNNGNQVLPIYGETIPITGAEMNNPAPSGRVTTTNGSGLWMKFTFNPRPFLNPGQLRFVRHHLHRAC